MTLTNHARVVSEPTQNCVIQAVPQDELASSDAIWLAVQRNQEFSVEIEVQPCLERTDQSQDSQHRFLGALHNIEDQSWKGCTVQSLEVR